MALVKCRNCGEQIDKVMAYKVVVGKLNHYYCTEAEYISEQEKIAQSKAIKDSVYSAINEIFNRQVTNTAIFKEMSEIAGVYGYDLLGDYLRENKQYLCQQLNKSFKSEYAQIRYFSTIAKNSMSDFKLKRKLQSSVVKQSSFEMVETNFTARQPRKGFEYIE